MCHVFPTYGSSSPRCERGDSRAHHVHQASGERIQVEWVVTSSNSAVGKKKGPLGIIYMPFYIHNMPLYIIYICLSLSIYIYIYIYIHIFALADPNPGPRNSRRLEPPSISTQPSSFQSRRYAVYISNTSRRLRCLGGDLNDLDPWRGEQDGFPWVSPSAIGSNVSLRYFPKPGPNSK